VPESKENMEEFGSPTVIVAFADPGLVLTKTLFRISILFRSVVI
jgi:hypothetical protein